MNFRSGITLITGLIIQAILILICLLKGKYRAALISCFVPFVAWFCGDSAGPAEVLVGKASSTAARRIARADCAGPRSSTSVGIPKARWLSDLIAGAPSLARSAGHRRARRKERSDCRLPRPHEQETRSICAASTPVRRPAIHCPASPVDAAGRTAGSARPRRTLGGRPHRPERPAPARRLRPVQVRRSRTADSTSRPASRLLDQCPDSTRRQARQALSTASAVHEASRTRRPRLGVGHGFVGETQVPAQRGDQQVDQLIVGHRPEHRPGRRTEQGHALARPGCCGRWRTRTVPSCRLPVDAGPGGPKVHPRTGVQLDLEARIGSSRPGDRCR